MVKDLGYLLEKGPSIIVGEYFKLLERVQSLVNSDDADKHQIAKVCKISLSKLYRRIKKPEMWEQEELVRFLRSHPIPNGIVIVEDYFKLLTNVQAIINAYNPDRILLSQSAKISLSGLYRRKNNPELWGKDELLKVFKYLKIK